MNKLQNLTQNLSRFALLLIVLLIGIAGPLACSHSAKKGIDAPQNSAPSPMQYRANEMPGALPKSVYGQSVCFADSLQKVRDGIAQKRMELYFMNRDLQSISRRLSADDEPPTRTATVTTHSTDSADKAQRPTPE